MSINAIPSLSDSYFSKWYVGDASFIDKYWACDNTNYITSDTNVRPYTNVMCLTKGVSVSCSEGQCGYTSCAELPKRYCEDDDVELYTLVDGLPVLQSACGYDNGDTCANVQKITEYPRISSEDVKHELTWASNTRSFLGTVICNKQIDKVLDPYTKQEHFLAYCLDENGMFVEGRKFECVGRTKKENREKRKYRCYNTVCEEWDPLLCTYGLDVYYANGTSQKKFEYNRSCMIDQGECVNTGSDAWGVMMLSALYVISVLL